MQQYLTAVEMIICALIVQENLSQTLQLNRPTLRDEEFDAIELQLLGLVAISGKRVGHKPSKSFYRPVIPFSINI